jgi:CDP-diacylglycerol--serine O-phosphatidyltransferase
MTFDIKNKIPNLITFTGLFLTLINLFWVLNANIIWFLFLLNLSIISDFLDGYFARKLNVESDFGAKFDLVHDFLLYVVLPLAYIRESFNSNLWIILSLILISSSSFRLVRFRKGGTVKIDNKTYWLGLPVIYNLSLILLVAARTEIKEIAFAILVLVLSALMPTKIKFQKLSSLKSIILLVIFNLLTFVFLFIR